jgi:hypothetical protein
MKHPPAYCRNVRRINHPALRDAGHAPGTGHGPSTVARQSATDSHPSAGMHGRRVPSHSSTVQPSDRPMWGWLIIAVTLMIGGVAVVSCNNDMDVFCAEAFCEETP